MKVAHFIATLDIGGAEKQLLTLCREQIEHGYEVVVFPLKGSDTLAPEFQKLGAEVNLQLKNKNVFMQYFYMFVFARNHTEVIFHGHSAKAQTLLSILPISKANRIVLSKHDAMSFIVRLPKSLSRLLWKWVQFRSAKALLISQAIGHEMDIRKEYIDPSKMTISYYGLSKSEVIEIKHSDREKIRLSWGVEDSNFVVGTVGRLVKEKNQLFLLDVFHKFLNSNPKAILVICGYGPLELELRKRIQSLRIGANVRILTRVENIKKVYVGFDLFVLPSSTEGFGLVLLEAMSADLPIIASRVGAIPEVLGYECKSLFDPTNEKELLDLLVRSSNDSFRKEMVINSSSRLNNFTSMAMFNRIDSLYKSL